MVSGQPKLFLDTWAWVVMADRRDPLHLSAIETYLGFRNSLQLTTDYVLDESISRLFERLPFSLAQRFVEKIWATRDDGRLLVVPITGERFAQAWQLRLRYRDKPRISFTDLTSFAVIDEFDVPNVLTGDAHFGQAGLRCKVLPSLLGP